MQPNNQAPVGIRKVMRSLDPLFLPRELWVKKKRKKKGSAQKVGADSHSKGQKGCWAQCPPSPPPPPALFPPAYIGLLSKIVIYAVF